MCGIAGRFNYRSGAPVEADTVRRMSDLIAHRGPDGSGVWSDGAVAFGHRRLAVIDLSPAAAQPFHSHDGRLTVVFNGEIYNYRELRKDLEARGCGFRTSSDTEVLLEAYRVFGPASVERLRGMFAFAIWDAPRRRLFLARDRVGKKPVYYRDDIDGIAFASEPKAFLADPGFLPEADPAALSHYLSFQYVPTPHSAFKGVRRLPPAHFLVVEDGTSRVERYWRLAYEPKESWSEEVAEEEVLARLREAVRLRMISDVPLGAFLSGGVDSSLVVALMAEAGQGPVRTFSIGFDEEEYNELPYAREVAQRLGTVHEEAVVRPDAVALLPKLVWHYNEPYADSSAIPVFYLSEMTRRHVTVALNGDGGDESFGGYERYAASLLAARVDRIPVGLRRGAARLARRVARGPARTTRARLTRFLEAAADSPARRYARWMFHFDEERKRALCTPEFLDDADAGRSTALLASAFEGAELGLLDATMRADVALYLPDDLLVKVDIATMAFGLEGRSPLLDAEVMAVAARLPESFKVRGLEKKYLLRRIARRFLPAAVLDRPKRGFGVPIDRWLRADLRDFARDVLLDGTLRSRGYFQMNVVEEMLRDHEQGKRSWHYQIWNLLMLELWHRTFIDVRGAGRP